MFGQGMLYYVSIFLFGVSVFIIALTMFSDEEKFKTQESLDGAEEDKNQADKEGGFILRYSRPFFKRYMSPMVASMKNKKAIREKYKQKLANAGLTDILTADDLYAFKLFMILAFPILYLGIREVGEMYDWPLIAAPFMGIVGFFYPDLWIRGRIENRQKEIVFGMPFIVDMLALSVEAGLDFMAAISKVTDRAPPGVLIDEFKTVLKEIKIGSSRAEALRNLVWRTNVIELASFVATLIAADSVGASIAPILKTLAAEIRQKRSSKIEEMGAKAATKILFPMMFLIVPAVFLIIGAPAGLQFLSGQ